MRRLQKTRRMEKKPRRLQRVRHEAYRPTVPRSYHREALYRRSERLSRH